jgi:hypothetical protein
MRKESKEVDIDRHEKGDTLKAKIGKTEHVKRIRQQFKPLQYSNDLLEHLVPLWEEVIHNWNSLISSRQTTPKHLNYHIQPTDVILVKLLQSDKSGSKTQLRASICSVRATMLLADTTHHLKLPKDY